MEAAQKPVLLKGLQTAQSAGEHPQQEVETEGDTMKRLIVVAVLLTGTWLLSVPSLHAQAASSEQASTVSSMDNEALIDQSVALLRQDLRSGKKQAIAASLQLRDAQATKFWPVYDQYSAELSKLGDQRYALIKEYANGFGTLTDNQALSACKAVAFAGRTGCAVAQQVRADRESGAARDKDSHVLSNGSIPQYVNRSEGVGGDSGCARAIVVTQESPRQRESTRASRRKNTR